jgi:hypothetical protein
MRPILLLCLASLLAAAEPVRILLLGESTTAGSYGGFRNVLYQELKQAKISFDFVGGVVGGPPILPDQEHEGDPGRKLSDLLRGLGEGLLEKHRPQVIHMMVGTNDFKIGADKVLVQYDQVLAEIRRRAPKAQLFISPHLPNNVRYEPTRMPYVVGFNAGLPQRVRDLVKAGASAHFIDLTAVNGTPHIQEDGVHPFEPGLKEMGGVKTFGLWDTAYDRYARRIARAIIGNLGKPGNMPPAIELVAPAADLGTDGPFTVEARASDADGSVVAVEVYASGAKVADLAKTGGDRWTGTVANLPPGTYDLRVRAIDDRGSDLSTFPLRDNGQPNSATYMVPRLVTVGGTPSALLAAWSFAETDGWAALDRSGHGHHLALLTSWQRADGGIAGPASYRPLAIADSAAIDLGQAWSFTARVKLGDVAKLKGAWPEFLVKPGRVKIGVWADPAPTRELFVWANGNVRSGLMIPADRWAFIGVAIGAGTVRCQVDGAAFQGAAGQAKPGSDKPAAIELMRLIPGAIADARLWSRALSAAELATLGAGGRVETGPAAAAPANLLPAPLVFANGVRLERATYAAPRLTLAWTLPSGLPADVAVGVHVVDAAGAITGKADHALPGASGSTTVDLPTGARRIGLALYRPDGSLSAVQGGPSDWDGKRALIGLP